MKASWPAPRKVQSRPHDGRSRPTRPPPAPRDPFALVCSLLLVPLLVSGYMATTLLTKALGTTAGRWRGLWLAGFAVATGLVIDLITTYWLKGLPSDSFWIVWPILALIILTVSLLAAVLRRLVGPLGIFLTVIVVVQFGNPSSGGANGVPYLPAFWNAIGPFLPPRNAYLLLRKTVYFDGGGIGQPLAILLAYVVVSGVVLFVFVRLLGRRRSQLWSRSEAYGWVRGRAGVAVLVRLSAWRTEPDRRSQTSKACEVKASVGSNPTSTATPISTNAGPRHRSRPGVAVPGALWSQSRSQLILRVDSGAGRVIGRHGGSERRAAHSR
jgi:hypothetical protein